MFEPSALLATADRKPGRKVVFWEGLTGNGKEESRRTQEVPHNAKKNVGSNLLANELNCIIFYTAPSTELPRAAKITSLNRCEDTLGLRR